MRGLLAHSPVYSLPALPTAAAHPSPVHTMSMRARSVASLYRRAAASLTQRSPSSLSAAAGVSWLCLERGQMAAGRPRAGLAGRRWSVARTPADEHSAEPACTASSMRDSFRCWPHQPLATCLSAGAGAPGGDCCRRRGRRRRWHNDEGGWGLRRFFAHSAACTALVTACHGLNQGMQTCRVSSKAAQPVQPGQGAHPAPLPRPLACCRACTAVDMPDCPAAPTINCLLCR